MGLCRTSNFSMFTFINANDLKFCARSFSSYVYRTMRFEGSNGKVCKNDDVTFSNYITNIITNITISLVLNCP